VFQTNTVWYASTYCLQDTLAKGRAQLPVLDTTTHICSRLHTHTPSAHNWGGCHHNTVALQQAEDNTIR
jgi:hypothetical protein